MSTPKASLVVEAQAYMQGMSEVSKQTATRRPLRQARRRRIAEVTLIVGGGTIAAMSLAALAFAMVSSAWTF